MTRYITLTGGHMVAVENIDINLPPELVDSQGRLRVSSASTQVQIKQESKFIREKTVSHGPIIPDRGLKAIENKNYIDIEAVGINGNYRIRSKQCALFQNGKSLLILFSFNFMSLGEPGVIKRVGYFDGSPADCTAPAPVIVTATATATAGCATATSTSTATSYCPAPAPATAIGGIWLEQNGTTVQWALSSDITDTVITEEPLNVTNDWTKCQIGFISIDYLGVGGIACGFIKDRKLVTTNIFNSTEEIEVPHFSNPNKYITYEMLIDRDSSYCNNISRFRAINAACLIEGGQENIGHSISINRFDGFSIPKGIKTPIFIFKQNVSNLRILISSIDVAFEKTGTYLVELYQFSTVGHLPYPEIDSSGSIAYYSPSSANLSFNGSSLYSYIACVGNTQSSINIDQYLDIDYKDSGGYFGIVITSSIRNLELLSCVVNFYLES